MTVSWRKVGGVALIPVGMVVLIAPCALRAWGPAGVSNKTWPDGYTHLNGRSVDGWTWRWLWPLFHNPEDGDSGITALIVQADGSVKSYNPTGSRWKAWLWSAWRNSVDGLKY